MFIDPGSVRCSFAAAMAEGSNSKQLLWGGYGRGNTGDDLTLAIAMQDAMGAYGASVAVLAPDRSAVRRVLPEAEVISFGKPRGLFRRLGNLALAHRFLNVGSFLYRLGCRDRLRGAEEGGLWTQAITSSNPISDPLCGSGAIPVWHDGAAFHKRAKVQAVASHVGIQRDARVCWQGARLDRNCGQCFKCVATQICYWLSGVPSPECFPHPGSLGEVARAVLKNDQNRYLFQSLHEEALRQGATRLTRALASALGRNTRRRLRRKMKQLCLRPGEFLDQLGIPCLPSLIGPINLLHASGTVIFSRVGNYSTLPFVHSEPSPSRRKISPVWSSANGRRFGSIPAGFGFSRGR